MSLANETSAGKNATVKNLVVLAITVVVVLVGVWVVQSMRSSPGEGTTGSDTGNETQVDGSADASANGTANDPAGETTDAMAPEGSGDDATPVDVEGAQGPLVVGEQAPSFTALSLDGDQVDLEQMRGKPVWLLFNATWCADCRAEIPDVIEAFEDYGDEVEFLSVYVSDSRRAVEEYSENLGIPYPQVVDETNHIAAAYGVVGLPTSVFMDAEGDVTKVQIGALSPSAMQSELQELVE